MNRLFVIGFILLSHTAYAESMLRVTCAEADVNSEIYVNGEFKGECPLDVKVQPGTLQLRVQKPVGTDKVRVFEQTLRMGDDSVKKVSAILEKLQWTQEGWAQEQIRLQKEKEEKEKLAALAEEKRLATFKLQEAALAQLKTQGAEPGNGMGFRDCPECPEMVLIPTGKFWMGSSKHEDDEKPVHQVTIDQVLAIGKYEVTQKEWQAIMGGNPSRNTSLFGNTGNYPVEQVSWDMVQDFIRRLNEKTGKHYRLPSEAEWEYACEANGGKQSCGTERYFKEFAWIKENSSGETHAVGGLSANPWGLHDMNGNVWEWVDDFYHADYSDAPADGGSQNTSGSGVYGSHRVLRGGSINSAGHELDSSYRNHKEASMSHWAMGFRLVRTIP